MKSTNSVFQVILLYCLCSDICDCVFKYTYLSSTLSVEEEYLTIFLGAGCFETSDPRSSSLLENNSADVSDLASSLLELYTNNETIITYVHQGSGLLINYLCSSYEAHTKFLETTHELHRKL